MSKSKCDFNRKRPETKTLSLFPGTFKQEQFYLSDALTVPHLLPPQAESANYLCFGAQGRSLYLLVSTLTTYVNQIVNSYPL